MSERGHLGPEHPVAAVVARLCGEHRRGEHLIGGVGCGSCWEQAIRNDERAVVLFGLPREIELDPDLIDEVAVELACVGHPVDLTVPERVEAVRQLTARGESASDIAMWLHIAERVVTRDRAAIRRAVGAMSDGEAA